MLFKLFKFFFSLVIIKVKVVMKNVAKMRSSAKEIKKGRGSFFP